MAANGLVGSTVPLTASQKARLATKFLPVVFFVLALSFVVAVLPNLLGQPVPILLPIFLVLVLLLMIYEASKSLRDLLSGVALVEEDELVRSWHTRGGSSARYGNFARLGKLRLTPRAFRDAHAGQNYRICYSPASRLVWSLEANEYWSGVTKK